MEVKLLVGLCVLQAALGQAWSSNLQEQLDPNPEPAVLYPWRQRAQGLSRVKRDWIIPPIRVSENSKQVPEDLVQIKSDKVFSGEVIYKLEGPGVDQDPKDLFEIDDRTGWIKSKMPLDREMYKSFTLKAFALSPSGERLENPTTIEIYILDQNDNKPTFVQEQFNGTVPEFSIPGTPVLMVSAEDADDPSTDNAMLSYSILQQESIPAFSINRTMFGINNTTGVIYTRDVGLDRTVVQGFRLTLQVADMSGIGLSSTSYANIYITDINNHPPRFSPDTYTMYVQENTDVPELGRVNATDRDEVGGENWRIKYTITDGDPNGNFAIHTDPLTNEGILSVEKPLDYESQAEHRLTLVAENVVPLVIRPLGDPISTATVTVRVRNENEAPRFHRDPIKVSAPESITPGTVLASDIAHDPDNAKLRFELRDPEGWLAIDEETGQISARAHFNIRSAHVKNNIYHAEVTVTDTDGGLSTTAALELTLWETNDFPPVLFPQSGIVCSNWEPHRRGLLVSAMDEDLSPHADPYTFDILSEMVVNWTIIQINETHAVLQPLMEMGRGEFSIQVLVSDSGSPVLASVWLVNVTVCPCDRYGDCQIMAAALLGSRVGISLIALIVIMASVALLLLLLLLSVAVGVCRRRSVKDGGGLLASESDEDVRDNVLNYDEQGGGEEDEDAFNIDLLRNPSDGVLPAGGFPSPSSSHPRGRQPLRKDAPHNLPSPTYPRKPPGSPTDIEDFINDGLDAADHDPNVPPYDTALIYDYEGDGSLAGSLSSVASSSSDGDQDYDYLSDWGPRFQKLANMYDPR